jgi:hypothetical protein
MRGQGSLSTATPNSSAQGTRPSCLTTSEVAAYRAALEAWRSSIPYIYKAIEGDDSVSVEEMKMRLAVK